MANPTYIFTYPLYISTHLASHATQYRRAFAPGATFFFTVVTARRRPLFGDAAACDLLRQALRRVAEQRPFAVSAMVVLPDHLHCLWTLPPDDVVPHPPAAGQNVGNATVRRRAHPVAAAVLGTPDSGRCPDYRQHVEYIHYNPVKHGYVARPSQWPYSSFRRYVKEGLYPEDWGSAEPVWQVAVGKE